MSKLRVRMVKGSRLGWYCQCVQEGLAQLAVEGAGEEGMKNIFSNIFTTVLAVWRAVWTHPVNSVQGREELVQKPPNKCRLIR